MTNNNVNPTPKFDFPVSKIMLNNDPRFGNITNVIIDFVDIYGFKHSKIYFLAREIEKLFNYSKIKMIISRLPSENKLLLRPMNLNSNNLLPFKISNRGSLMVDIIGLNRIIMRSNLPAAIEYQNWVYEDVFPKLWMYGMYINPLKINQMIKQIFTNTLYNHNPSSIDDPVVIDLDELDKYSYLVNNNQYILIDNSTDIKTRIFNVAFRKYIGRNFTSLINDIITIENPFIIALDVGGPELVKAIYLCVNQIIIDMHVGFTLEEIESGHINPKHSLYNIDMNGAKYREYQDSKKNISVDLDKINKEYRKEQESKKYGINIDEVVDK